MTDCRREFPASWFAGVKLCAEHHDARLNYFGSTPLSRSPRGAAKAGFVRRTRAAGSVVLPLLHGSPDGGRCASDPTMAGNRAPRCGNSEKLRAGRSRVPAQAAPGRAPLGVRQPKICSGDAMSDVPLRRPIRIGISACLLGERVRFDGGHKQDPFLSGTFGRFVEWVPVCPEVEAGLGTPREAMRLVRTQDGVRLLTVKTARDLKATLNDYAEAESRRWRRRSYADTSSRKTRRAATGAGQGLRRTQRSHEIRTRTIRGQAGAAHRPDDDATLCISAFAHV